MGADDEEDQNRFAEADRLEAGGLDPLGGKSRQVVGLKLLVSDIRFGDASNGVFWEVLWC